MKIQYFYYGIATQMTAMLENDLVVSGLNSLARWKSRPWFEKIS
jgi:hypothetical protein